MKKFLVTYLAPASVIDDWRKTEPEKRKQGDIVKCCVWRCDQAAIFLTVLLCTSTPFLN